MSMNVSFWGVRGSIAAPMTSADIAQGVAEFMAEFPKDRPATPEEIKSHLWTHGGNTSCVMIEAGGERIILDMGTGLRPLGNMLMREALSKMGIKATFLISHVHWDHIQGLPFFAPLYLNKHRDFKNRLHFYGGTEYRAHLDDCLRGQMDAPNFPVPFPEIESLTYEMKFRHLQDGLEFAVGDSHVFNRGSKGRVSVTCRKLDHPQEVYAFRIEFGGKVVAFTTDHEPRHPEVPYQSLLELVKGADVWITDCQYSGHQYKGLDGGPQRFGWGHAYPEAIAATARLAGVQKVVTFHHDPSNGAAKVHEIAKDVWNLWGPGRGNVIAAHEGLVLEV